MKIRLKTYLDKSISDYAENFDPEWNLLGAYPAAFYTPDYLQEHFGALGPRALHSFPISLAYALALQVREPDALAQRRVVDIVRSSLNLAPLANGELKWFLEEKHLRDANGNFFSGLLLFLLERHFGHLWPDSLRSDVQKQLQRLLPVFQAERATSNLSYVNPTLARYTICCLLAEHFDAKNADKERKEFLSYARHLRERGVNESYTPTYYSVDLMILLAALSATSDKVLQQEAQSLLHQLFLKQIVFFGNRFPAPFRRGYNGEYLSHRQDFLPFLLSWNPDYQAGTDAYLNLALPAVLALFLQQNPDFQIKAADEFPRTLQSRVADDCQGYSFLDKNFLLGSFDRYPGSTTVWQCVTTGGSGWQDAPVFLSLENPRLSSMVLRLEAIDAQDQLQTHPFQGKFSMSKMLRIYPWRSFPPEPKLRCLQQNGEMLCLWKIDRVDAELKRLGFNLHFSRCQPKIYDLDSENPLPDNSCKDRLLLDIDGIWLFLAALQRVDMAHSSLSQGRFLPPSLHCQYGTDTLDCSMFNYDGDAQSFVQNHISGGFFLAVLNPCTDLQTARQQTRLYSISDQFISNRYDGHIDQRDSIRKVSVKSPNGNLELVCDHYQWK